VKVLLRIEPAKPRPNQNGLFLPSSPEPEKLELTLARISAVVGEGRAGSPIIMDSHRREAFEMRRFSPSAVAFWRAALPRQPQSPTRVARKGVKVMEGDERHEPEDLVTALRIFRPPIAVTVSQQNGKPSHIFFKKEKQFSGDILWAAGPWRSSGDWWEHDAWLRDEWDIAVQQEGNIALYRLVYDVLAGRWMLEGSYD
jgi:protein ImuB